LHNTWPYTNPASDHYNAECVEYNIYIYLVSGNWKYKFTRPESSTLHLSSAAHCACARQNVLPGVMYRQNRYTAAAFNIVHNSIFYSLQVYYNVTFAERKAKSTLIGSAGMREITAFMTHSWFVYSQIRGEYPKTSKNRWDDEGQVYEKRLKQNVQKSIALVPKYYSSVDCNYTNRKFVLLNWECFEY